jgi:hypothetical protein
MQQGLQKAILSPSFTPRVRDSEAVADLLWQGLATPQAVTVALLRIGRPAIPALLRVLACGRRLRGGPSWCRCWVA